MPLSQVAPISTYLPGMQLVGWAFISASGTILKGSGIAAATSPTASGYSTVTFLSAQPDTNYAVVMRTQYGASAGALTEPEHMPSLSGVSTAACTLSFGTQFANVRTYHVAVYR